MKNTVSFLEKKAETEAEAYSQLYEILNRLRAPDGCPWDRAQTPETFYKNLIEESYEYIDAFLKNDITECGEELGDMMLVVTMLTIMHEEKNDFTAVQIINDTCEKLVRRHPHVFDLESDHDADNPDSVVKLWDSIKENIEGKKKVDDIFAFIPGSMPNMLQSMEIQKKAAKKGFNWDSSSGILKKIEEEMNELHEELEQSEPVTDRIIDEFGDILFSMVNYAVFMKINPDDALYRANRKFRRRFTSMTELMNLDGLSLDDNLSLEQMDAYWNRIKEQENL